MPATFSIPFIRGGAAIAGGCAFPLAQAGDSSQ